MKILKLVILAGIFFLNTNLIYAAVDDDASVLYLRTSCMENGSEINNCFTSMGALNNWLWDPQRVPAPSSSHPVAVNIGPGTFVGQFSCTNSGYVSLHGSGMGNTILENSALPINVNHCVDMKFTHLTVRNTGTTLLGIMWQGGGSSTWENVEVDMMGYGWAEGAGSGCAWEPGEHYWFSSKIKTHPYPYTGSSTAYYATCDVSWFFGSELTSKGTTNGSVVKPINGIGGEVHVYGSVIRAMSDAGITTNQFVAAEASYGGEVHIHGTGIDLISPEANNLVALRAKAGSMIHANQSAFVMKTGTGGTKTRIAEEGDGKVNGAYLWEKSANAPGIISTTGSDMVVVTNTSDGKPHMLISNSSCTSGWHDTVTNNCY